MNPKNTVILVLVAAALFLFIFFVEPLFKKPQAGPARVIQGLKPDLVQSLEILRSGQKEIALVRTNGGWEMTYPRVCPAQTLQVEMLLRAAALLMPQTRISAQELSGKRNASEEFGFDNPQATIVFQQGADSVRLQLGSLTMPGDQIYAQVVGYANVDIIDAEFFRKLVPREANDWRDTSFVSLTNVAFERLTVNSGAQQFELARDNTNAPWRMTKPVQSRADNPRIQSLLSGLQSLRVTHFVSDDPKVDLEAYGLQPAAVELKFQRGTNDLLTVQFGKSPTNDETQIYARINNGNSILQVPREHVLPWAAGFQDFRDRHLVRFAEGLPDSIEVVDADREGFTAQRQPDETWRVIKPLDLPAGTNLMQSFLGRLSGMEVERINNQVAVDDTALPNDPRYGLEKPARRYILKRASRNGARATNEIMAEIDFGSVKDGRIFARRADRPEESSVYAVRLADFQQLPATGLQLRARRIWDFSETNVASITIRQGGKTQQLVHKGPNQWSIASGSGIFNDLEVEVGAQELGFLEAQNWIERGDQNRAHYGFSDQSLQIAVEVKEQGKPQMLKLDFGGVAPDGLRYGDTRLDDGQNWIFEIPPRLLDRVITYLNIHENPGH